MNSLDERDARLAEMDHGPLLRSVRSVVDDASASDIQFRPQAGILFADVDALARRCVERTKRARIGDPVRPGTGAARTVTLNMGQAEWDALRTQTLGLRDAVRAHLDGAAGAHGLSVAGLAAGLLRPLEDNQRDKQTLATDRHLLHHDLTTPIPVYRQRLSLEKETRAGTRKRVFRWHKVLIGVEQSDFEGQMQAALSRCIEDWAADEDDQADLRIALQRMIDSPTSRLAMLKKVIDTQTIGQVKKEAQIRYLEFLAGAFETTHLCRTLLLDLARRLRLLQRYAHDLTRAEGDYEFSYQGRSCDYRALLAPADVYGALPVIPQVEGHLGEVTGEARRERLYTFGMRLKLNGLAQSEGRLTSFGYHVAQLAPEHTAWAERKALLFLLYTVVFDQFGDLSYDPLSAFLAGPFPILRGSDDEAKQRLFEQAYHQLRAAPALEAHLSALVEGLRDKFRRGYLPPNEVYPVHIALLRNVLDSTAHERGAAPFFRDKLFAPSWRLLSCIAVTDAAVASTALYKLTAEIRFDTMTAYELPGEGARHDFTMRYLRDGVDGCAHLQQLPIVLGPGGKGLRDQYLTGSSGLLLTTRDATQPLTRSPADDFVYRYAHAVLSWMIISTLVATLDSAIFLPIPRFHQTPKLDGGPDDQFVAALGKVFAHLLGQRHLSSTQGLSLLDPTTERYRLKNARSSLYAPLPKSFDGALPSAAATVPQQCAILVVSSRGCDDVSGDGDGTRVVTISGESIGLRRTDDGAVSLRRVRTLTGSYTIQQAFSTPTAVLDEVQRLYAQGYRHIVYIAQAPYTSTLHMTDADDDDHLFFMSRAIVRQFKAGRDDLVIYPVFFGKYPAVEYRGAGATTGATRQSRSGRSLYIQDAWELQTLLRDPGKEIAVFLNLFTGKTVRALENTLYNEVISYSTLINVYRDIMDDTAIVTGLIVDQDGTNEVKNALILYLTLLHFARYETDSGDVVLKLDPYTTIIGGDSVGKHACIPHWSRNRTFNLLAFLNAVEQIITVPQS